MGALEIGDYRGSSVVLDTMSQLRKKNSKRVKVNITIKFKGMLVVNEKTKVRNRNGMGQDIIN